MKKILIPIDFSENTITSCMYALEIAKRFNSEIRLFHSYFDQVIVSDSSFPTGIDTDTMLNEQLLRDIKIRATSDIQNLQTHLLNLLKKDKIKDVKIVYTLVGGEPESEILGECNGYLPDMIVMGSSGKGKKNILTGSVSKNVMNNANIPVLTVPENYKYNGINNVLYMTDFDGPDNKLIEKLIFVLKDFDVKIHCMHLNIKESRRSENEACMSQIKSHFEKEIENGKICCHLIEGNEINEDIESFVKKNNIEMICFLSHKRNIFKRLFTSKVTKKELFQSGIPLMAFHTKS